MLSRSELHQAAHRLGWHWYEAPLFAVLDLLTVRQPISRLQFSRCIQEMADDPMGPYGKVLLNAAHYRPPPTPADHPQAPQNLGHHRATSPKPPRTSPRHDGNQRLVDILFSHAGHDAAEDYRHLVDTLDPAHIPMVDAALLIIDAQQSFTSGVWMRSMGSNADVEVQPIVLAFQCCTALLERVYRQMAVMFTRCPFPPASYGWDKRLAPILDDRQLYFIKPGNSVLYPPLNGYNKWVDDCNDSGKTILVMGGCTLNSCVRVSAIDTQIRFGRSMLQVVVDLILCGARVTNYRPSKQFGGHSAVVSAVRQMIDAGVRVVRHVRWR